MGRKECFRKIFSLPNVLKIWLKCAQYLDINPYLLSTTKESCDHHILSVETHEAVDVKVFCDPSGGGRRRLIRILRKPMIDASIANCRMWLNPITNIHTRVVGRNVHILSFSLSIFIRIGAQNVDDTSLASVLPLKDHVTIKC